MTQNRKIRIGITHGDTNGIGYEVILKMLSDERIAQMYTVTLYGSAKAATFYRKAMELPQIQFNRVDSAADAREDVVNIVNVVGEDLKIEPGVESAEAGAAALAALDAAVADIKAGAIDIIVTAPINKKAIQSEQFHFAGHTEYLQAAFAPEDGSEAAHALMMLCAGNLRVALVTTHMPLRDVPDAINTEGVTARIAELDASLRRDFGIHAPRIAVLSLNPHAGENGLLGDEEANVIAPAIAAARDSRIMVFGPYAADGFFGSGHFSAFDGVLAMYHDQGLAPFKTLAMDGGVNFTAGLPYVRTSPDHGTGFDIAGKGVADPQSMRQALYLGVDIFRNRAAHDEAYRRPLRRQHMERDKGEKE